MDAHSVTAPVASEATLSRRVRWWRRRPPSRLTRFARGVWWTGHAQLFISVTLLVIGPVCLMLWFLPPTVLTAWSAAVGMLGTAMALPFAVSGRLLRAYGAAMVQNPDSRARETVQLAIAIAGIALLAILLVIVCMLLLILVLAAAWSVVTA